MIRGSKRNEAELTTKPAVIVAQCSGQCSCRCKGQKKCIQSTLIDSISTHRNIRHEQV